MDLAVFYEVIVPLMEVEGTATICISTPLDEFNFYSELTELRDDKGRLIFNVKHIKGNIPVPWKSAEGTRILFTLRFASSVHDDGQFSFGCC